MLIPKRSPLAEQGRAKGQLARNPPVREPRAWAPAATRATSGRQGPAMKWFIAGLLVGATTTYVALTIWFRAILLSAVRSARRTLRQSHAPKSNASEAIGIERRRR